MFYRIMLFLRCFFTFKHWCFNDFITIQRYFDDFIMDNTLLRDDIMLTIMCPLHVHV